MRICGQESVYHGDDKLIVMTALICRGTCQNKINAQKVIGLPNDNKFTDTSRDTYEIKNTPGRPPNLTVDLFMYRHAPGRFFSLTYCNLT